MQSKRFWLSQVKAQNMFYAKRETQSIYVSSENLPQTIPHDISQLQTIAT